VRRVEIPLVGVVSKPGMGDESSSDTFFSIGLLICGLSLSVFIAPVLFFGGEIVVAFSSGLSVANLENALRAALNSRYSIAAIVGGAGLFPFGVASLVEGMMDSE